MYIKGRNLYYGTQICVILNYSPVKKSYMGSIFGSDFYFGFYFSHWGLFVESPNGKNFKSQRVGVNYLNIVLLNFSISNSFQSPDDISSIDLIN
ncbi:hypothetical protein POVCU2_0032470 [Plasmodium ovale curtisi]|uniref:Uncharacterized protein n=1 Tax=Plasmodium ovale curtisi TaxID=864141 RepID=A0A1A8VYP6_PLAOA|nr:hypothetical protein POVCU2_0032470 [Plasmodium ovale curtisi]SBS95656.1 hypothetical protein POVCU1_029940 [Plasmodium ovale curtisi]